MDEFQDKQRTSYPQDWKAYDAAQTLELSSFTKLLSDLCKNVEQPSYDFGRPKLPFSDMVFASALKVYTTFSLRRFLSQMQRAVELKFIDTSCSYVSVSNFMRKKELTPVLIDLVRLSSLPLASVETTFGVDSTGFSTSTFARYFSYRHGKVKDYKVWIKAHVASGLKTNIVTAIHLTQDDSNDSKFFIPLLERTAMGFDLKVAVADKAYNSRKNIQFVEDIGGVAYIPFRKNARGLAMGSPAWNRMYHFFELHREEFLKLYHKRSNCESTFSMIKGKFRGSVRSKDLTAQINEVLLKVLCHNICVVNQEIHELGIQADFVNVGSGT